MSNMMPGDNSGAEPRPHDPRCRMSCDDDDCTFRDGHYCTCDDLAADDAEREAQALMEYTYQQYLHDKEP
jgi:hypothetical protein